MIMKYFILFCWLIFLAEALFLNQIKHIPGKGFEEGHKVIPIILLANLFLGIYYNLAVWYKLTDKTHFGAIISVIGAIISIVGNFILIPHLGYMGSAWTTLICYFSMVIISYFWGRKHMHIPYNIRKILFYSILALSMYFASMIPEPESMTQILISTALFLTYISTILIIEKPRKLLS
jgi:O-antigen/teichoic acid export membrane protein